MDSVKTFRKSKLYGWEATDDVDMGPITWDKREGRRVLRIATRKSKRGLQTTASVHMEVGTAIICVLFQDFHRLVLATEKRATEKSVREQQEWVLQNQGYILLKDAHAFYAARDARNAEEAQAA